MFMTLSSAAHTTAALRLAYVVPGSEPEVRKKNNKKKESAKIATKNINNKHTHTSGGEKSISSIE